MVGLGGRFHKGCKLGNREARMGDMRMPGHVWSFGVFCVDSRPATLCYPGCRLQ